MSTDGQILDDGCAHLAQSVAQLLPRTMQLAVEPSVDMDYDDHYLAPHQHLFSQLVQHRLLSAVHHLQLVASKKSISNDLLTLWWRVALEFERVNG